MYDDDTVANNDSVDHGHFFYTGNPEQRNTYPRLDHADTSR
jgi:hypothetical protein